jgi:molybdenum cofactor cytidylyltransferase
MDAHPVTAVILAAGMSRRMGQQNKLLLPVLGEPMVRRVVRTALESRCRKVVVVLGHEADQIGRALDGLEVEFVVSEHYQEGMGASLRAGVSAVAEGNAAVICLGDMPYVDAEVINALLNAYAPDQGISICQAAYRGQRGNPVLWGPEHLSTLRASAGDVGGRALLARAAGRVAVVEVGCAGVLHDIDQPEDLAKGSQQFSGGESPG